MHTHTPRTHVRLHTHAINDRKIIRKIVYVFLALDMHRYISPIYTHAHAHTHAFTLNILIYIYTHTHTFT